MRIKRNKPLTKIQLRKTSKTKKKILEQMVIDNYEKLPKELKIVYRYLKEEKAVKNVK